MGVRVVLIAFVFLASSTALFAQPRDPASDSSIGTVTLSAAAADELRRLQTSGDVRVERRRNDSVLNGALIGAGVGVASGLLLCRAMEPWEVCNDPGPLVRIGAVGAGIGIAIDALIRKRETVDVTRGSAQVSVAPVGGRRAKGLQVAVRF